MRNTNESGQSDTSNSTMRSVPRVTVSGTVRRRRKPSKVTISVSVDAESRSREDALDELAQKLKKIEAIVEKFGETLIARTGSPNERTQEREKVLRTVETIRFDVLVELELSNADRLGELLVELLNEKLSFSPPQFEHEQVTGFSHDEHGEAARQAREIAEALAAGSGCTLGAILSIKLPGLQSDQFKVKLRDWTGWRPQFFQNFMLSSASPRFERNEALESMLGSSIPEYTDVLTVEVTYQLLS
jgi:uncharacterized protein YggE